MKALRLIGIGQPLVLEEIETPPVGPRDVLIRVRGAGICHSDVHYRSGTLSADLPVTPGHEVAGEVAAAGAEVTRIGVGDRVCLHYLATCGECAPCREGHEQFCASGEMFGKQRDGGYAEYVKAPARSVFPLPDEIPFREGAVMMCSSATSFHALNKARFCAGETVACFGIGGLGISAIQLARALGAREVVGVDLDPTKLALAEYLGAIPVDGGATDPVEEIRRLTGGAGVDVALELVGLPETMRQAVRCLAPRGRAALAGITDEPLTIDSFHDLLAPEAEVIGVSDHLASEIPLLTDLVRRRRVDLSHAVTVTAPLEAAAVNAVLDGLERFQGVARAVITL